MNARRIAACVAVACLFTGCSDDPAAGPDYTLLLDDDAKPDQMKGKAGRYGLTARGDGTPYLAVLDVPAGYTNFGFFAIWPVESVYTRAVQYWTVNGVYDDPCNRTGPAPAIGESVEDLATALAAQKLTEASEPEPVTLDGHAGLYLELTVPMGVNIEDCTAGYYMFWEGKPGDAHHQASSPGAVEATWILDVDGERVVLSAISEKAVTAAEVDEVRAMAESVEFVKL